MPFPEPLLSDARFQRGPLCQPCRREHGRRSSSRGLPYGLKDVGTDINGGSCNKITKELSSSKIDEGSVGQWVEIREHDQL